MPPDAPAADRRRAERVPYHMKTTVYGSSRFAAGTVRDLSAVGAYVQCWGPLPAGDSVDMALDLPAGRVRVTGRVAWSQAEGEHHVGMGIEFVDLRPAVQEALKDYVSWRLRSSRE